MILLVIAASQNSLVFPQSLLSSVLTRLLSLFGSFYQNDLDKNWIVQC